MQLQRVAPGRQNEIGRHRAKKLTGVLDFRIVV